MKKQRKVKGSLPVYKGVVEEFTPQEPLLAEEKKMPTGEKELNKQAVRFKRTSL